MSMNKRDPLVGRPTRHRAENSEQFTLDLGSRDDPEVSLNVSDHRNNGINIRVSESGKVGGSFRLLRREAMDLARWILEGE